MESPLEFAILKIEGVQRAKILNFNLETLKPRETLKPGL
jgi:hypothetical protein